MDLAHSIFGIQHALWSIFLAVLWAVYHLHGIKNAINRQTEWMVEDEGDEEDDEELGSDRTS